MRSCLFCIKLNIVEVISGFVVRINEKYIKFKWEKKRVSLPIKQHEIKIQMLFTNLVITITSDFLTFMFMKNRKNTICWLTHCIFPPICLSAKFKIVNGYFCCWKLLILIFVYHNFTFSNINKNWNEFANDKYWILHLNCNLIL